MPNFRNNRGPDRRQAIRHCIFLLFLTTPFLHSSEDFAIVCATWHGPSASCFDLSSPLPDPAAAAPVWAGLGDESSMEPSPPFGLNSEHEANPLMQPDPLPTSFGAFCRLLGSDSLTVVTAPLRWRTEEWLQIGFAAVVIGATSRHIDHQADRYNRGPNRTQPRAFWTHVSDWGIAIPYLAIGAHGLIGYAWDLAPAKRVFLDGAESVVIVSTLLLVFKISIGRSLPDSRSRAFQFKPFHNGWDTAFPSGHTVQAFVAASVLAFSYPDQPWIGAGALSIAGAVGYSRLYLHQHWVTDVMAGAMLAMMVGWEIVHLHRHPASAASGAEANSASWLPNQVGLFQQGGNTGLAFEWQF